MKLTSTLTLSAIVLALSVPNSAQASWLDRLLGKKESSSESTPVSANPLDDFTDAITEGAKRAGGSLAKELAKDLNGNVSQLAGLLGASPEQSKALNSTLAALKNNFSVQDITAIMEGFTALQSGSLNEEQTAALTSTMASAAAFGMQAFLSDKPYKSDVEKAVQALRSGDYVSAIQPIIALSNNANLAPEHRAMVDTAKGYFESLASNKIVDGIKGFLN